MIRKYLTCLTLTLFATTPLHGADREHEQLMADLRMLQEQTSQLHHLIAALEGTLSTLSVRLDEQDAELRRSFADQKLTTDSMATGVRVLRENWTKQMCDCHQCRRKWRRFASLSPVPHLPQ